MNDRLWMNHDLHLLGQQLGALPMAVGGSSAGARLAILFALRHPQAVRALLLWRVTGGQEAVDRLAESYYGQFIPVARAGGMQAICESEHFRACIEARPSNRGRLLAIDPAEFIAVPDLAALVCLPRQLAARVQCQRGVTAFGPD